ncbi:hypothetical protein ACLBKU_04485 [Erythrobacter sp. NE805]|uniref:hypothetical protein n=1 Tax=Erythrobacter sp. NE805 TaxID=3389875 RepID=UPI00396B3C42
MQTQSTASFDLTPGSAGVTPAMSKGKARDRRYLFGPVVDFLCLGGSSLLLLPFLFMLPEARYAGPVTTLMLLLANVLNHPHFAHSYQIFYRGFARKAFTLSLGREMQARYLFAGLVAPVLLAAFLAWGALAKDTRLLGHGANLMVLAVGWHYAKQGYGMLMVDAVLKRRFLDERTKKVLLVNCYAVWLAAWVNLNVAISKDDLWGLAYYSFALPRPLQIVTGLAAMATSAAATWALAMHWKRKGALPVNGVVAYGVSLYLWLLFVNVNPLWGLVVPALHSLQYLVVVWRFQLNYETAQLSSEAYRKGSMIRALFGANPAGHLAVFVIFGALLGFLGFWGVPVAVDGLVPYDRQAIPGALFPFMFWIFLNVHHYVLDSVMWRSGNPDTKTHLFG